MTDAPPLRLFNSLTRQLETFQPIHPGEARVYSCGPTVYNYQHVGNMRAYLFALLSKAGKARAPGRSRGVVVVNIPARPFLRPAFKKFSKGAQKRYLRRVARLLGMGGA